jgi:hypothetical protein
MGMERRGRAWNWVAGTEGRRVLTESAAFIDALVMFGDVKRFSQTYKLLAFPDLNDSEQRNSSRNK